MLLEYRSNISDIFKFIVEDREGLGVFGKFYIVVLFMFGISFYGFCKLYNFNGVLKVNLLILVILI